MVIKIVQLLMAANILNYQPYLADELDEAALMIYEACADGPREEPVGLECAAATVAVWYNESRYSMYPRHTPGDGWGVGQVLVRERWGNHRLGYGPTPPSVDMQYNPRIGFHWIVKSFRAKRMKVRTMRSAFRSYNGHPAYKERYATKAIRIYTRILREVRDVELPDCDSSVRRCVYRVRNIPRT